MSAASAAGNLVPFEKGHARTVSAWAPTPGEVVSWCGPAETPVPPTTVAD